MIQITKEQFEDILFDPRLSIVETKSRSRATKKVLIKLTCGGKTIAKREVGPEGNFYYAS
jgi:hypothetical protein